MTGQTFLQKVSWRGVRGGREPLEVGPWRRGEGRERGPGWAFGVEPAIGLGKQPPMIFASMSRSRVLLWLRHLGKIRVSKKKKKAGLVADTGEFLAGRVAQPILPGGVKTAGWRRNTVIPALLPIFLLHPTDSAWKRGPAWKRLARQPTAINFRYLMGLEFAARLRLAWSCLAL